MREPLKDNIRFEHMLEAIDNVAQFTAGETEESLSNNKLRKHATAYNIQIIGESAYQVSKEFKESHQETPQPQSLMLWG